MAAKIVFFIGFFLLILFCPLVSQVFNAGTIAGTALSLCLIFSALFHRRIISFLRHSLDKLTGKLIIFPTAVLLAALVIFAAAASVMIIVQACKVPSNDAPATVIVLGCKVNGTRPSLYLMSRIKAAHKYLSEHEDAVCILSGGQGPDEGISEAQAMYNYLTDMGIGGDRLYIEDSSSSTYENFKYSKELITKHGLSENIAVVTNSFHQLRASMIASKLGLTVSSVNAHLIRPSYPTYFLREIMGVAYELLLG